MMKLVGWAFFAQESVERYGRCKQPASDLQHEDIPFSHFQSDWNKVLIFLLLSIHSAWRGLVSYLTPI